jgi:hypothetical protein
VKKEERTHWGQWNLLFQWTDALFPSRLEDMHCIQPPPDRFYADPFTSCEQGRHFIFFEEYPLENPIGYISVVEVFRDGTTSEVTPVLKCPYHLSYPWVFRQNGQWYMLPETHQNKTIELWEAVEFPWRWKRAHVLMDQVEAADTTPYFHDGRWWLFTALRQGCKKFGDRLFLFHGDDLFGRRWTPHARNPVRQGYVHERPAGNLFMHDNKVVRPAQDSLRRYGGAVELRHVTELDPERYRESTLLRIEPDEGSAFRGTHTINHGNGLLVLDGLRLIPRHGQ